jgi:NitT/TauT family transport system substrate-binding protein
MAIYHNHRPTIALVAGLVFCSGVLFTVAVVFAAATDGPAKDGLTKVRLVIGSQPGNIVYLQIDLARALGYFEQEKLDVSFRYFDGGTDAALALNNGEYDFSANSIDHAIKLRDGSRELEMIASFTDLPCVTLVLRRDLRPRIRSLRELKGLRLGVTALGAGTHVLLASVLKHAGLSLKDVVVIPVGSGDSFIAAVHRHDIDAGMATDPTTTRLLLAGDASILLDMTNDDETSLIFNGHYQFTGLMTRGSVLRERPAVAQAMVNSIVKTNRYIHTHSAAEIASVLPASIVGDRYIYLKSLEHSRPAFSADGSMTAVAVANNIQSQLTFGLPVQGPAPEPARFMDDRFVRAYLAH